MPKPALASSALGSLRVSSADAARRAARFAAERAQADTVFAPPQRGHAHPDGRGVVLGDKRAKLVEVASERLATGEGLTPAQLAMLAGYGVSLESLASPTSADEASRGAKAAEAKAEVRGMHSGARVHDRP
jgi:hypothetical protein